jgi:small subunit ribosomal protein S8
MNGYNALLHKVVLLNSKLVRAVLDILKQEGYVKEYVLNATTSGHIAPTTLTVTLCYYNKKPLIGKIRLISKCGCRIYRGVQDLKTVAGFGISIVSTNKGVMTAHAAKKLNVGGEELLHLYNYGGNNV